MNSAFRCKGEKVAVAKALWASLPADPELLGQLEHNTVRYLTVPILELVAQVTDNSSEIVRREAALRVLFRSVDPTLTVNARRTDIGVEYVLYVRTHTDSVKDSPLKTRAVALLRQLSTSGKFPDVREASKEYLAYYLHKPPM